MCQVHTSPALSRSVLMEGEPDRSTLSRATARARPVTPLPIIRRYVAWRHPTNCRRPGEGTVALSSQDTALGDTTADSGVISLTGLVYRVD